MLGGGGQVELLFEVEEAPVHIEGRAGCEGDHGHAEGAVRFDCMAGGQRFPLFALVGGGAGRAGDGDDQAQALVGR